MGDDDGYRTIYKLGETLTFGAPPKNRSDLFINYAGADDKNTDLDLTITYSLQFEQIDAASGKAVAVEKPGKFYVDTAGSALAVPEKLGKYSGILLARDTAGGGTTEVKKWGFEIRDVLACSAGSKLSDDLLKCDLIDPCPNSCTCSADLLATHVTVECTDAASIIDQLPSKLPRNTKTVRLRTDDFAAVDTFFDQMRSTPGVVGQGPVIVLNPKPELDAGGDGDAQASSFSDAEVDTNLLKIAPIPEHFCDTERSNVVVCSKDVPCGGEQFGSTGSNKSASTSGALAAPAAGGTVPCDKGYAACALPFTPALIIAILPTSEYMPSNGKIAIISLRRLLCQAIFQRGLT